MIKKFLIFIIVIYFLTLIQTSFLVHFMIWGKVLNLVFILVVFWNLFEGTKKYFGIYLAFLGGFFLDIFSSHFIGWNILFLGITAVFIKLVFKKYVKIPFFEKK